MKSDTRALANMLSMRRPHRSRTEKQFIREYIWPLGVKRDSRGNLYKRIGDAPVLWSCHTDSVHRMAGFQGIKIEGGVMSLALGSHSNCLGADDAAGCWLMREMIRANRPGLYVFHRAEEIGAHGSSWIAEKNPEFLKDIKHAIAFDRRGTQDVITFQSWKRCASDDFASELAKRLNAANDELDYKPSPDGIFTDTASYVRLVPECTNLSVGYHHEHTSAERLDLKHLFALRKALLKLDVADLPAVRDPSKTEHKYSNYGGAYWGGDDNWSYEGGNWKYRPDRNHSRVYAGHEIEEDNKSERATGTNIVPYRSPNANHNRATAWTPNVVETIRKNPDAVLKVLESYGISHAQVLDEIYEQGGTLHYF